MLPVILLLPMAGLALTEVEEEAEEEEDEWEEEESVGVEKGDEVFPRGRPPRGLPGWPPDFDRPGRRERGEGEGE